MLLERDIHPDIKTMLLSNKPFEYGHLVKFERPSRPASTTGLTASSAEQYTYISDTSVNITFDDGSVNASNVPNGPQIYLANKVLNLSTVSEDTEAKASSYSVTLDGNGLGAYISSPCSIVAKDSDTFTVTFTSPYVDLIKSGFREGDKVTVVTAQSPLGPPLTIVNFTGPNSFVLRTQDPNKKLAAASSTTATVTLASEEIVSILLDKNAPEYASFINREVFIYRIYRQNGKTVGTPFMLFKGIISGVNFDDSDNNLTVTWSLTSHWGDFSQVKGRITSDDFHRALDQSGNPQPLSALKTAYAYDKGFAHAETSVNILAQYSVKVEKQDIKVKKGFLGIGSKVKVRKYMVDETRGSQLDFQLQAKSIPVIYGVRTTEGIPVFADTLNNDSSTVYVVEVLSEGEIGGIYDVYTDGNSLICNDKTDFDARSTQGTEDRVKLICRGRADRGDVLGGTVSTNPSVNTDFYTTYSFDPSTQYTYRLPYDLPNVNTYKPYVPPVTAVADNTGAGVIDGQSITLSSPQNITYDVFTGKPNQRAASSLVAIAAANNFKIQNAYWSGTNSADYWSPNHRLLDSAYIVGKYKIEEGETTIPSTEYVVRGKVVDCYNYDYSYSHDIQYPAEVADNFLLGDTVTLQKMDGTALQAAVQIVDKWTITNPDGTRNVRFRFSTPPALAYVKGVPTITNFRMTKSGAGFWTMVTYNHGAASGTVPSNARIPITGADASGAYTRFTFSANSEAPVGAEPGEASPAFSVVNSAGMPVPNDYFASSVLIGPMTTSSLTTKYSWGFTGAAAIKLVGNSFLVKRNIVKLATSASSTSGFYNNYTILVTRIDIAGRKTVQKRRIVAYDGATRTATIDGLWDYGLDPLAGDTYKLIQPYADSRITINPAMQLMDYITSPTYGRGLDPNIDLNLESWLESARVCDQQSNMTVNYTGGALAVGDVYKYPSTGPILWQGKVSGIYSGHAEFTEVIGKLSNNWNNWRRYNVGELVYSDQFLYRVTTAGVVPTKPVHTSGTSQGLERITSLSLTKVSGNSGSSASLPVAVDGNPVRALDGNGVRIPGYSLYDSDGVDYWRMLGWDEFAQRYVTRHQTNLIVDTALPLLDNVNSFLDHFDGILRYTGGQYYLGVEEPEYVIDESSVRHITPDDIFGRIRLSDEGTRSSYNSLTAAYSDPANKFESRNVSFFNSDYLRADKNVPKKGSLTVPGITNYYNTRLIADRFLNKSRFGLTVSFNMVPAGVMLLAGTVIQINYARYGWVNKKFRITNITHQTDASVDVVAKEYDASFYGLTRIQKQAASGLAGNTAVITEIAPPTNLHVTNETNGDETTSAIQLTWKNNPVASPQNTFTEIYSSYSKELYVQIQSIDQNVLTTIEPEHGLVVGEVVKATATAGTIAKDASYFVKSILAPNKFTISETKNGPIMGLTSLASLSLNMLTANLIATVPVPANTYTDVFGGITGTRVAKYYWVRHKVIQV